LGGVFGYSGLYFFEGICYGLAARIEMLLTRPGRISKGIGKRKIKAYAGILKVSSLAKRRFVDVHMDLFQAVAGDVDVPPVQC
jgi:hypothetical protein